LAFIAEKIGMLALSRASTAATGLSFERISFMTLYSSTGPVPGFETKDQQDDRSLECQGPESKDLDCGNQGAIEKEGKASPAQGTAVQQGIYHKSARRFPSRLDGRFEAGPAPVGQCTQKNLARKALESYVLYGQEEGLRSLARKGDGFGFEADERAVLIPQSYFAQLLDVLDQSCPMRRVADVEQVAGRRYDILVEDSKDDKMTAALWAPQKMEDLLGADLWKNPMGTPLPNFRKMSLEMRSMIAYPMISEELDDLRGGDVGQFLHSIYSSEFVKGQNDAFCHGDPAKNQPQGFLPKKASDELGDDLADSLIVMMHKLPPHFRTNGTWMMSGRALSIVRQLRNRNGDYILSNGSQGPTESLLGYPVQQYDNLEEGEKGSWIAFGDFHKGYKIIERPNLELKRNEYVSFPHLRFMVRYFVGGGVVRPEAIRTLFVPADAQVLKEGRQA
jgi:HK97 family phage major capsid protein